MTGGNLIAAWPRWGRLPGQARLRAAWRRLLPVRPGAVLASRRGGVAVLFAASGTLLVGAVGLATEGSLIYLTSRNARNGADAAAMAAASAYQFRGRAAALGAATEVAGRNGFAAALVTVNNPPATGTLAGNTAAFEVTIHKQVPVTLSRAIGSPASVPVSARAVAVLRSTTPACIVALTGSLTVQNSSTFDAAGCAVGSNGAGASVQIPQSNSTVKARAVMAAGTCTGCSNTRWSFTEGYQEHAAPLSNPYEPLDTKPYVTATGASCLNTTPISVQGPIQPTGTGKAYCASVTIANWGAVTLSPGTYVFQNASLSVGRIASLACAGCTFIFRGASPGNLSISNTSTVTLSAPATNGSDADYNGVLFHRATGGAMGSSGAPNLNLQSVSSFNLAGGIYFPGSYVRIGNVSSAGSTNCLALVGGTIEIGNLSSFRFDTSNCASYGTAVPAARIVRLGE